jgi:oxepin-CoA hydrolase/3-oxo-5,6-dehydrosuberyl-CoA semialdehyde dehydrogenase
VTVLRSYVAGRWFAPGSGSPVYDAVTGQEIAEVSSDGVDFGAALAHGRSA